MTENALPFVRRLAFGVGHVLNDLCASMWFTYLLVYYHQVIDFSNVMAGYVLLLGQIVDGICTPLVGLESDRTNGLFGYGKRKTWHAVGTLCVICSFPFLFNPCISCEDSPNWAQFIYYAPFVVIFQFGWAATQISHLSLIPDLTPHDLERVELNSMRYAFTVLSSITVYGITWLLLQTSGSDVLDEHDVPQFRILAFTVVGIGAVFSLIFHIGVKEEKEDRSAIGEVKNVKVAMSWKCWLKEPQFYLVAMLYMCTRLIVNLTQVYMPMYLTETLDMSKSYIAIIPLTIFVSGIIGTFMMRPLNKKFGKKITYFLGLFLCGASILWLYFVPLMNRLFVFGPAILLGFGTSTILVTSLGIVADLIGENFESGAFVYGAMSFTDKLSNGLAVNVIQQLHPCRGHACCPSCKPFYRAVMGYVPGGVVVVAIVTLLILIPQKIGKRRKGQYLEDSMPAVCDIPTMNDGEESTASEDVRLLKDHTNLYGSASPRLVSRTATINNSRKSMYLRDSIHDRTPFTENVSSVTSEECSVKCNGEKIDDVQKAI